MEEDHFDVFHVYISFSLYVCYIFLNIHKYCGLSATFLCSAFRFSVSVRSFEQEMSNKSSENCRSSLAAYFLFVCMRSLARCSLFNFRCSRFMLFPYHHVS